MPDPEFFLNQEALLPYLNRARFVVLQVMSGRSQSNSYYACDGLEYRHPAARRAPDGREGGVRRVMSGPDALRRLPLPYRLRRSSAA